MSLLEPCAVCGSNAGSHMSDCPVLAKAFKQVEVHPEWSRNPFHDKPEVGLADILVELQSIRDMQDRRQADILEAVREHKFFLLHIDTQTTELVDAVRALKPIDSAEAHIELQKSVVDRGYQPGDGALMASLYAANKRQLDKLDRLLAENATLISACDEYKRACRECNAMEAELKRFRDREPLVQELLAQAIDKEGLVDGERDESCAFCEAIAAVRDFKPAPQPVNQGRSTPTATQTGEG